MRLVRLLLATLAAGLACAPAASAATVVTDKPCYQEGADVVTAGSGFVRNASVSVYLDAINLGSAPTNAQGVFLNKFVAPTLPAGKREQIRRIVATDAVNVAVRHFRLTEVSAGFSPSAGALDSLRVRFKVYGFGIYTPAAKVYVHYVRPNGKARRTVYLGTARGTCGHIRATRKRLLFPFVAERGVWTLQFDTRKVYGKATAASTFAWVRRPVKVAASG